jgi:hypothetical protein
MNNESWCNCHEPMPIHADSVASEHDVFQDCADREQAFFDNYSINFQGNYMTNSHTPVAAAVAQASTKVYVRPAARSTSFDLLDYIDENCHHPRMKMMMTASMAGTFDAHMVQTARNVYFELLAKNRDTEAERGMAPSIDSYNNFKAAFTERLDGIDETDTTFAKLKKLASARNLFHDEAGAAHIASNARPFYAMRDLDEMLTDERPREVDSNARAKLFERAKMIDPINPVKQQDRLIKQAQAQSDKNAEYALDNAPLVSAVLAEAQRAADEDIEFTDLPDDTQRYMIVKAIEKFDVVADKLAGYTSVSSDDYRQILSVVTAAQSELSDLVAKRWPAEDQDTPAMTRAERRQKAEAIADDVAPAKAKRAKAMAVRKAATKETAALN